jgi:hypothetical protein
MSPEQTPSAKNVDGRTDVWSLGVVLYQLPHRPAALRRRVACPDLYVAIVARAPLQPRELREDTPPALEDVIIRCLQKQREERYSRRRPAWPSGDRAVRAARGARHVAVVIKRLLARAVAPRSIGGPQAGRDRAGKPKLGERVRGRATRRRSARLLGARRPPAAPRSSWRSCPVGEER